MKLPVFILTLVLSFCSYAQTDFLFNSGFDDQKSYSVFLIDPQTTNSVVHFKDVLLEPSDIDFATMNVVGRKSWVLGPLLVCSYPYSNEVNSSLNSDECEKVSPDRVFIPTVIGIFTPYDSPITEAQRLLNFKAEDGRHVIIYGYNIAQNSMLVSVQMSSQTYSSQFEVWSLDKLPDSVEINELISRTRLHKRQFN